MAPQNVLVYLIGFAGVGKLTVARQLAPLMDARIVDNHWINNPIFGLVDNDRVTPLPTAVWDQVEKVRLAVLDTIATLSPPLANFILTNSLGDDDPEDWKIYDAVLATAKRRKALFVPVRLVCDEVQLRKRVISPERAVRLKRMDPEAASRELRDLKTLMSRYANELTLDISEIGPDISAQLIYDHVKGLRRQ